MFGWDRNVITGSDKFIVDDWNQFKTYIHSHQNNPYGPLPKPDAELAEVIINKHRGRFSETDRIVNFNLGLAIHDIAIAQCVFNVAKEKKLGQKCCFMKNPLPFGL